MNASAGSSGRAAEFQYAFGTQFFKYLAVGREDWDYASYDLARWQADTAAAARYLNAVDSDLSRFRAQRRKADPVARVGRPGAEPAFYHRVLRSVQARDANVRDYARLFMMPGVLHCGGGAGPDSSTGSRRLRSGWSTATLPSA